MDPTKHGRKFEIDHGYKLPSPPVPTNIRTNISRAKNAGKFYFLIAMRDDGTSVYAKLTGDALDFARAKRRVLKEEGAWKGEDGDAIVSSTEEEAVPSPSFDVKKAKINAETKRKLAEILEANARKRTLQKELKERRADQYDRNRRKNLAQDDDARLVLVRRHELDWPDSPNNDTPKYAELWKGADNHGEIALIALSGDDYQTFRRGSFADAETLYNNLVSAEPSIDILRTEASYRKLATDFWAVKASIESATMVRAHEVRKKRDGVFLLTAMEARKQEANAEEVTVPFAPHLAFLFAVYTLHLKQTCKDKFENKEEFRTNIVDKYQSHLARRNGRSADKGCTPLAPPDSQRELQTRALNFHLSQEKLKRNRLLEILGNLPLFHPQDTTSRKYAEEMMKNIAKHGCVKSCRKAKKPVIKKRFSDLADIFDFGTTCLGFRLVLGEDKATDTIASLLRSNKIRNDIIENHGNTLDSENHIPMSFGQMNLNLDVLAEKSLFYFNTGVGKLASGNRPTEFGRVVRGEDIHDTPCDIFIENSGNWIIDYRKIVRKTRVQNSPIIPLILRILVSGNPFTRMVQIRSRDLDPVGKKVMKKYQSDLEQGKVSRRDVPLRAIPGLENVYDRRYRATTFTHQYYCLDAETALNLQYKPRLADLQTKGAWSSPSMLHNHYAKNAYNAETVAGEMQTKEPIDYYGIRERLMIPRRDQNGAVINEVDVMLGSTSFDAWLLKKWYTTTKSAIERQLRLPLTTDSTSASVISLDAARTSNDALLALDKLVIDLFDEFIGHIGAPKTPWKRPETDLAKEMFLHGRQLGTSETANKVAAAVGYLTGSFESIIVALGQTNPDVELVKMLAKRALETIQGQTPELPPASGE